MNLVQLLSFGVKAASVITELQASPEFADVEKNLPALAEEVTALVADAKALPLAQIEKDLSALVALVKSKV